MYSLYRLGRTRRNTPTPQRRRRAPERRSAPLERPNALRTPNYTNKRCNELYDGVTGPRSSNGASSRSTTGDYETDPRRLRSLPSILRVRPGVDIDGAPTASAERRGFSVGVNVAVSTA